MTSRGAGVAYLVVFGGGSGIVLSGLHRDLCCGAHWNRLGEAIPMGAHSVGLCGEICGIIT